MSSAAELHVLYWIGNEEGVQRTPPSARREGPPPARGKPIRSQYGGAVQVLIGRSRCPGPRFRG